MWTCCCRYHSCHFFLHSGTFYYFITLNWTSADIHSVWLVPDNVIVIVDCKILVVKDSLISKWSVTATYTKVGMHFCRISCNVTFPAIFFSAFDSASVVEIMFAICLRGRFGSVGNVVVRINEVNQCQARLVLGWVTDRLLAGKPSRYVTSHPGQLSLAIPPWVCAVSTSESWDVNRHTARCTSPVSVVWHCKLVSGWGLMKQRSAPPLWA